MAKFDIYFVFIIFALGTVLAVKGNEHKVFYSEMLSLHNIQRLNHSVSVLIMSDELTREAILFAQRWILQNDNSYDENSPYGYNFFAMTSVNDTELTALQVFLGWYKKCKKYNYSKEPSNRSADFFTQIVWKETRFLGLAKLKVGSKTVVVAKYFPAGNIIGKYKKNVGPPQT